MDMFGQLISPFLILLALVTITLAIYWPIWTFLAARRVCRDLHSISESLHWIAHCTGSPEQKAMARIARAPKPTGAISTSAFGR
jgi:hypothetical protein